MPPLTHLRVRLTPTHSSTSSWLRYSLHLHGGRPCPCPSLPCCTGCLCVLAAWGHGHILCGHILCGLGFVGHTLGLQLALKLSKGGGGGQTGKRGPRQERGEQAGKRGKRRGGEREGGGQATAETGRQATAAAASRVEEGEAGSQMAGSQAGG